MRLPFLLLLSGVLVALTVANLVRPPLDPEEGPPDEPQTMVAQSPAAMSGGGVPAVPLPQPSPESVHGSGAAADAATALESEEEEIGFEINTDRSSNSGALENQPVALPARPEGSRVRLSWETVREFHNQGYDVQLQAPGADYATVATVPAGRAGSEGSGYVWASDSLAAGRYSARLVQRSADGHSVRSAPVRFTITAPAPAPGRAALRLVPEGEAGWRVVAAQTERVQVVLLDADGVPVQTLWSGLAGPTRAPLVGVPEGGAGTGHAVRAESASGTAEVTLPRPTARGNE